MGHIINKLRQDLWNLVNKAESETKNKEENQDIPEVINHLSLYSDNLQLRESIKISH